MIVKREMAAVGVDEHRFLVGNIHKPVQLEITRVGVILAVDAARAVPHVNEPLRRLHPCGIGGLDLRPLGGGHFAEVGEGFARFKEALLPLVMPIGGRGLGDEITPPTYISVYKPFTIRVCIAIGV